MLFREGGDPLLFQSHSNTFAAELIMATMEPKIILRKETAGAAKAAASAGGSGGGVAKREPGVGGDGGGGTVNEEGGGRGYSPDKQRRQEEEEGGGGGPSWEHADAPIRDGGGRGVGEGGRWRGGGEGGGRENGGESQDSEATRAPASHDEVGAALPAMHAALMEPTIWRCLPPPPLDDSVDVLVRWFSFVGLRGDCSTPATLFRESEVAGQQAAAAAAAAVVAAAEASRGKQIRRERVQSKMAAHIKSSKFWD